MVLWFGHVFVILRENVSLDTGIECSGHKNVSRKICCPTHNLGIVFVQWYEILDEKKLCVDEVVRTLSFTRLKWKGTKRKCKRLFSAAECGLFPAGSIKGFVYIVKKNFASDLLDDSQPRKSNAELLSQKEEGWPRKLFCVNRVFNMPIDEQHKK